MTEPFDRQSVGFARRWCMMLMLCSVAGLVALFAGRIFGPSDLWDQTQVKTVSYTTDIIVHGGGHWILPIERGELPATKPPLYNWLAAPMVKWLGFNSEIAHRFPSIVAMCLSWLIVVRLGRAIDCGDGALGWLAGLALVGNGAMFKLGYLARPDMLLTLWLLLGWIAATALLIDGRWLPSSKRQWMIIGFWSCVVLAALTKGPPAVVLPLYALIAARVLGGSWSSARVFNWQWGIPAAIFACGLWVYAVWRINPDHLLNKLWYEEIYGRITGVGPEGNGEGPIGSIKDMFVQAAYFVVRFLPWSLPAIAGMWTILRTGRTAPVNPWLVASTIQVLVIVGLFTLSTGKRADYIAGAFPPGAILAGWWLLRSAPRLAIRLLWLAPLAAIATMTAVIVVNQRQNHAPAKGFGDAIRSFIDQSTEQITREPLPLFFCWSGGTQLQAMLGSSQKDGNEAVFAAIERGQPFWVVAGRKTSEPHDFGPWLRSKRKNVTIEAVASSIRLPAAQGWPEQVTLYRVAPAAP